MLGADVIGTDRMGRRPDSGLAVVAIGGFDPSGGAGVVRDFVTARALGASARLLPTAWTEQSAAGVTAVEPRDVDALRRAIRVALGATHGTGSAQDGRIVLKIGMLPNARAADAVADAISDFTGPVVFDPVLSASSGGALYAGEPDALLALAARATVVTPNAAEVAVLTGVTVQTPDDATRAGQVCCARGARAVLVKGGHLGGRMAVDVLVAGEDVRRFAAPRLPGKPVRGTGCALATAIAIGLGRGLALDLAVARAKSWLHDAIARATDVGNERHLA